MTTETPELIGMLQPRAAKSAVENWQSKIPLSLSGGCVAEKSALVFFNIFLTVYI
jgi:hypothetical protein